MGTGANPPGGTTITATSTLAGGMGTTTGSATAVGSTGSGTVAGDTATTSTITGVGGAGTMTTGVLGMSATSVGGGAATTTTNTSAGTTGTTNVGGAVGSTGVSGTGVTGTGGGTTGEPADPVFTPNVKLNDDSGNGRQTEVTMATGPNGLAMAGWMDERSQRVCAFSVSTDSGATWSENYAIELTSGDFVGDPAVGIDDAGTLYAVCQEYGLNQIRMMTSNDAGATWSENRQIQSAPDKPWVGGGVTQGEVFVSWLGEQAGIKRSRDGGLTWGPIEPVGNIIHGTGITATKSGYVHVPFNAYGNQLRYLRSGNGGDSWDDLRDLVSDMGSFCFGCSPRQHPIVGSDADETGQYVAITWASRRGGSQEENVWLLYSDDYGESWSEPIGVHADETEERQFQSWVAVDAHGRVHVTWTDLRDDGLNKTFYARSADPRQGFEQSIEVTDDRGSANTDFLGDYKGIAISGADVLIVWQDTRNDSGDIYFSRAPGAAGP